MKTLFVNKGSLAIYVYIAFSNIKIWARGKIVIKRFPDTKQISHYCVLRSTLVVALRCSYQVILNDFRKVYGIIYY